MKKMQYGGKSVPGSTRIKKDGKWVNISDMVFTKMAESAKRKKAENSGASKPVTILKGVDRRDEIGKPLKPMVLKKPTASKPEKSSTPNKPSSSSKLDFNKGKDPIQQYGVVKPGSSIVPNKPPLKKTNPNKITKPISFKRNKPITLSAKSEGVKSPSPIGKTPEGVVKNVSLSRPSSTASKSSASQKPTLKDLRKEKRSERKLTRMDRREDRREDRQDRRENRIINKTAKLKAKR